MWTGLKKYHADLVRRGTASEDSARYGEIQRIALPWLAPLVGMVIVAMVADPLAGPHAYWITICAALLLGLPAMLGITYATATYLIAGLRADRNKRALPKRRPS
jgi:hypothetical protein